MKNNKGFTLVEVIAIISVISILAVIIVPIVVKTINNSKEDSAKISALAFISSIDKYYMSNAEADMNSNFELDGEYIVNENKLKKIGSNEEHEIEITGEKPIGGFLTYSNNKLVTGCLTINEYAVDLDNDKVSDISKGTCVQIGIEYTFDYTGGEQTFTAPQSGYYKLEVWGAQGGSITDYYGGYGGYSTGVIKLNNSQKLYINVGGEGNSTTNSTIDGGYNGGGAISVEASCDNNFGAGGGASSIALSSGLLSTFENKKNDILIVAGGGGGASYRYCSSSDIVRGNGSSSGGYKGTSADYYTTWTKLEATGGTQTSGGIGGTTDSAPGKTDGIFGKGGSYTRTGGWTGQAGGGGGFYGGGLGMFSPGGGGSSYIGNTNLINKSMFCYGCEEAIETNIKTISTIGTSIEKNTTNCPNGYSEAPISKCAKTGNGYVLITYIGKSVKTNSDETFFDYTGGEQTFTVPQSGYYKLEVWGAQGGSITDYYGGYGGYSTGVIKLNNSQKLYINVGGEGNSTTNSTIDGGYNGGGAISVEASCDNNFGAGGGASSIALSSGLLSTFENKKNDILIVAGGGGGASYRYCSSSDIVRGNGSSSGGYKGTSADYYTTWTKLEATGGTQTSGGIGGTTDSAPGKTDGIFGKGGSYTRTGGWTGQAGGGGGFYGGGLGMFSPGGGGSSYIGNTNLINKSMFCYGCEEAIETNIKTISTIGTSIEKNTTNCPNGYSEAPISKCAKSGNGFAKITYIGETLN